MDKTHAEEALFDVSAVAGVSCLVAGVWVSFGLGRALMLTGAMLLFGCWKSA